VRTAWLELFLRDTDDNTSIGKLACAFKLGSARWEREYIMKD
jgi:hypothetical protein